MKVVLLLEDGTKMEVHKVVNYNVFVDESSERGQELDEQPEDEMTKQEYETDEVAQKPVEGELFKVTPKEIDRSMFEKPMGDQRQEETRILIQEAFAEVDKYPEIYAEPFFTLIPERDWELWITFKELEAYANNLGGEIANWVRQALEWAQRIFNGESWEDICNKSFTVKFNRAILWKNGNYKVVGDGICTDTDSESYIYPASSISKRDYPSYFKCISCVPLVVIKK